MFGTAVGEGAANDWLALMLVDNRAAPAAFGALTYAGFNLTMALGRFAGGVIIQRFGRAPVLRVAGLMASAGVAALCLIPSTVVALLGALAWGLGLSVVSHRRCPPRERCQDVVPERSLWCRQSATAAFSGSSADRLPCPFHAPRSGPPGGRSPGVAGRDPRLGRPRTRFQTRQAGTRGREVTDTRCGARSSDRRTVRTLFSGMKGAR